MRKNKNKTALLVFIRDPRHEAKLKVFAKHIGFGGNQKLADKLNKRIIALSRSTGLPFFVFDSFIQRGATFGERFSNSLEAVFQKGFEKVIAIGNDCLSLTKKSLLLAHDELRDNDLVLGPTLDGGCYLIGVSQQVFNLREFKGFNWTTPKLFDDFQEYILNKNISTSFLEKALDIDDEKDLRLALKSMSRQIKLRIVIEQILAVLSTQIFIFLNVFQNLFLQRFLPLRAPPL